MANDILIVPGDAQIQFSGSGDQNIYITVNASGSVSFVGKSGSLFSVEDTFTGSLFSVTDVSGFPIFEVFSSYTSSFDGHVNASFESINIPSTGSSPTGSTTFTSESATVPLVYDTLNHFLYLYVAGTWKSSSFA